MNNQTTFQFELPAQNHNDFIIANSNLQAYRYIADPEAPHHWPEQRLLLIGPEASGKSLLAQRFAQVSGAIYLHHKDALDIDNTSALIVEDICRFENENQLFHIINQSREEGVRLLLTAQYMPQYRLRDLNSRIRATSKVVIKSPDDALLREILNMQFQKRQLRVMPEVLEYILTRSERSYTYIQRLIYLLDTLSLEQKRNITVPLVREVLIEHLPQNIEDEL